MSDLTRIVVDDTDYCETIWYTEVAEREHPLSAHWCVRLRGHQGRCRCWDDGCRSWAERVDPTDG